MKQVEFKTGVGLGLSLPGMIDTHSNGSQIQKSRC